MDTQELGRLAQQLDRETFERAEDAALELLGTAMSRNSLDPSELERRREVIFAALDQMRETGYGKALGQAVADAVERLGEDAPDKDRALRFARLVADKGLDQVAREALDNLDRQVSARAFNKACIKATLKFAASVVGTVAVCVGGVIRCILAAIGSVEVGLAAAEACGLFDDTAP